MNFLLVAQILGSAFKNKSLTGVIQKYGIDLLLTIVGAVMEAEQIPLFQKPGSGPEKAKWVINKLMEILQKQGIIQAGQQIPDWLPAVINDLVKLINKFIKRK